MMDLVLLALVLIWFAWLALWVLAGSVVGLWAIGVAARRMALRGLKRPC